MFGLASHWCDPPQAEAIFYNFHISFGLLDVNLVLDVVGKCKSKMLHNCNHNVNAVNQKIYMLRQLLRLQTTI